MNLLLALSEENYSQTFSAYRRWIELEATRVGVTSRKLYNDVLGSTGPGPGLMWPPKSYVSRGSRYISGQLIHNNAQLLLRFVTDAEQDPTLSAYAVGLHEQLCRSSLDEFFKQILGCTPASTEVQLREFYTQTNFIAHWVNLGYVRLEDVRDHILQSLAMNPTVQTHQLNSLMILLKISGATFAAYADPSVMDHCCDLLKPSNLGGKLVLAELAEVRVLISPTQINHVCLDYRRFCGFVKTGGQASLLPQHSAAQSLKSPNRRTPRQLRSRLLWGSQAWRNSLRYLPSPPLFQRHPRLLPLRQSALLLCPISRSLTTSMMNRSSNPKLSLLTTNSTLRTEVLKFYVGKFSSAYTLARCHSILQSSVKCFHPRTLPLPNLQTGAHASCPLTHHWILQLS